MMYLSTYLIRALDDFKEFLFWMGLLTALQREWDNASVIKIEEMSVNLDPGYTNREYEGRYLSGIRIK